MGGSWGQRWFSLPCYQHHSDRSSADACAEYKNSLGLMSVARFQKMCPPQCLWTVKVIWLGMRCSILHTQSICVLSQGLYRSSCLIRLCWQCRLLLCFAAKSMSSSGLLTEADVSAAPANAAQFPFSSSQSWKKASALEIRTCQHWFMSKKTIVSLCLMSVCIWETASVCFCLCVC